jgi:hypothetical protein
MEIFNPGVRARKKLVSSISRLGVAEGVSANYADFINR